MFSYKELFYAFCNENNLNLHLSFDMPKGYENAFGTFDCELKTVFINAEYLINLSDSEKAFFLFHELRHAMQYLCPEQFSETIRHSMVYTIMFDGTCYKLIDGKYHECKLNGYDFTKLYKGQPYEVDANTFAYNRAKSIYGDSDELQSEYEYWMPQNTIPQEVYDSIYNEIDRKVYCGKS